MRKTLYSKRYMLIEKRKGNTLYCRDLNGPYSFRKEFDISQKNGRKSSELCQPGQIIKTYFRPDKNRWYFRLIGS